MDLQKSLREPVSSHMLASYVSARPDATVTSAAKAMKEAGSTEAVVVDAGQPVGILTERDILYKVVAEGLDPSQVSVGKVMSAPIQTIDSSARVGDAIAKMSSLGVRRLGVTRDGKLVGLVTQKNLATGEVGQSVLLPELAEPGVVACPYCGARFPDSKELSKHIDRAHIGLGLLEGNLGNW